jgi:hypothetical protein
MTEKDYVMIASILYYYKDEKCANDLIHDFINDFKNENPKFNEDIFLKDIYKN